MTEKIKLALALLLIASGLGAFYYLQQAEVALVLRLLALLGAIGLALAVWWTTPSGKAALVFIRESIAEARKVVWPTRKETVQTTVTVFVLVLITGLFLWVVDVALLWAVKVLMGRGA